MKVAIIGCGNMGWAYAKSLLRSDFITETNLFFYEKYVPRAEEIKLETTAFISSELDANLSACDFIIVAVKPQSFKELSQELKPFINNQVLISIMAGVSIELIQSLTGVPKVVRAMPNTPCQIGKGITGFYCNSNTKAEDKKIIEQLLSLTGESAEVKTEDNIDAVTSVSGSGPAYFFYFIKAMTEAGVTNGLTTEAAQKLALETMNGVYHLMNSSDKTVDEQIASVTSKGGTTLAALDTFDATGVDKGIREGVLNAKKRAKELSEMIAKES